MKRNLIGKVSAFLIVTMLLTGCVTTKSAKIADSGDRLEDIIEIYNSLGGKVYMGISGKYTDDQEASKVAMMNCAKNIALSEELVMRADVDSQIFSGLDYERFKVSSQAIYDTSRINSILGDMKILKMDRGDFETGVYVLASYGDSGNRSFSYSSGKDAKGRPDWIKELPTIPGYTTSVGMVKEYYYLQDSLEAAAYDGAVGLVLNKSDSLHVSNSVMSQASTSTRFSEDIYQISVNALQDFTVLEYWYDRTERMYYALVAARN